MKWKIEIRKNAKKDLKKIDKKHSKRILDFLENRLSKLDNPRSIGKPLQGNLSDYWRYRIGDFRIIANIQDKKLIILVVRIGDRKNIY